VALRSAMACGAALVAASPALGAPPFARVRTLAAAHGTGTVTALAGTQGLHTRLWVVRPGGTAVAHGTGDVTCAEHLAGGAAGESEMFAFTIAPNGRQTVWRRLGGTVDCTVRVSLRGRGRLALLLRGS
jgi:hypothetical protein